MGPFGPLLLVCRAKEAIPLRVRYWEIIADNLSKAGWSWGCSSQIDSTGRVLFTADAYSRGGRRFTVLSDEKLSAFLELERVTSVAPGAKSKLAIRSLLRCGSRRSTNSLPSVRGRILRAMDLDEKMAAPTTALAAKTSAQPG